MIRIEEAKQRFGMSDWELADAYNATTGGFRRGQELHRDPLAEAEEMAPGRVIVVDPEAA